MRLLRFFIKEYGVLKEFDIRFHHREHGPVASSYSLDVLVGLNGSGKSTVLRALTEVFRNLERSTPVRFQFSLDYERPRALGSVRVSVSNLVPTLGVSHGLTILVDDQPSEWSNDLLPDAIIAFTTGNEEAWNEYSVDDEPDSPRELPGDWAARETYGWLSSSRVEKSSSDSTASRCRFIKNSELSLVTLCGHLGALCSDDVVASRALKDVFAHAGLDTIVGFSLRFRVTSGLIAPNELTTVDLLGKLANRAVALGADRLFIFDLSIQGRSHAGKILDRFSGSFNFYRTLSNMLVSTDDPERSLGEISLFVAPQEDSDKIAPLLIFDWLSDGERSLIGRMCLLMLIRDIDGLVLLDEPEVHFNDYWKRRMLDFLDKVMHGQKSHVLITTHSSITLTDLLKEDIIALQRAGAFTRDASNPTMTTFGADPAEVMVQLFSSEYATGQRAVSAIMSALEARPPEERASQIEELEQLLQDVSPGYWTYRIKSEIKRLRI